MREVSSRGLFIGNARDARDPRALVDRGIEAVVDLAAEEPPMAALRDLILLRLPLVDGDGNPPARLNLALQGTALLLRHGLRTLVACGAGMSRAPAIAAGALSQTSGLPLEQCLEEVWAGFPGDMSPGLWRGIREVCDPGPLGG